MGRKVLNKNIYNIKGDITELIITNTKDEKIIVLIDTEDIEKVNRYNWCAGWRKDKQRYYIQVIIPNTSTKSNKTTLLLHKYIMNVYGMYDQVDHKDHNSLNNTKNNLRVVIPRNNSKNRKTSNTNNTTGYRNVSYIKGKYIVQLQIEGKNKRLGKFNNVHEAGEFAKQMREKYYGEFKGES